MSFPSLVLALALSSLYSLVFFLILGHGWRRLIFYWTVGVAGFFLGQWIAALVGLSILSIGDLNLVEGTVVCWIGLFAARAWRR